ncbi:MAG TPA: WHG domain-containing protein [Streptosporangiaceae bacterium]|jgi:AcrR family transcriptional regulator
MPRVGLNRERVTAAAAAVADEVGMGRLTLAAVAQRCGVSLPGLYKHVEGLGAVKRDIALLAVRELTFELATAAAGLSGRDALLAIARAYRGYALAHPGRYAATVWAPAPGDDEHAAVGAAAISVLAAVLKGYRIEGEDAIDAIRMMRAALHGFVSMEAAGGFGLPQSVDVSFIRLVEALDTAWITWVSRGQAVAGEGGSDPARR